MDYPSNSHRFKEEQTKPPVVEERRKVDQVVTGIAKPRKKSEFSKVIDLFISQDAPKIKSYILHDVFMPAFKKAVMGSIDMLFNGGHSSGYSQSYDSKPKIRYSGFAEEPNYRKATGTVVAKSNVEYADIEYPNRAAAERVLLTMRDIHAEFQSVTLAELYEMSGLDHPYTYTKYGWTSLRDAKIVKRGDGYFIELPPAELVTN